MNSPRFNELKEKYNNAYCRKDQLRKYAELGVISKDEYKEICGEDFTSQ